MPWWHGKVRGLTGALALGWIGVVGMIFLSWFYKKTVTSDALSYLFWFYSGVIAAASMRMRRDDIVRASTSARVSPAAD